MWCVNEVVIIRFCCGFFLSFEANEAGETPLDIARRLRHVQCEELVSPRSFRLTQSVTSSVQRQPSVISFVCVYS